MPKTPAVTINAITTVVRKESTCGESVPVLVVGGSVGVGVADEGGMPTFGISKSDIGFTQGW